MNLDKFNDYLFDKVFESVKNDETILVLSERLRGYLLELKEHPIANRILSDTGIISKDTFKITLLDISDKNDSKGDEILDSISFTQSNKAIELVAKELDITLTKGQELQSYNADRIKYFLNGSDNTEYFNKNRSDTTLGKIINKLYPNIYKASGDPGNDIESLVNQYKALRSFEPTFELVKGSDINYWYNERRYGTPRQGSLYGSCMRYSSCEDYLDFYSENKDKVSLLILKDPNDDSYIVGRAIVWKLDKIDGEEITEDSEPRYFMDRIYYTNEHYIDIFKRHAKQNGWLFKFRQNMDEDEAIIDSKTGESKSTIVVNDLKDTGVGHYPYMDTMKYFDYDEGIISNNSDEMIGDYYTFTNTGGGAEGVNVGYWSDYYDNYIDIEYGDYIWCEYGDDYRYYDDCFYSDYYNETVAQDYADRNGVFCDYYDGSDDWRMDGDYETSSDGKTATKEYAENNWYWSDYSNEWEIEAVYSEHHQTYINERDAVEVYVDAEQSDKDWRADDDDTWFTWDRDGEKYDENVSESELEEYHGLNDEDEDEDEDED